MPAVRISGSVYHNIGSALKSDAASAAQFLQVFFHEGTGESKKIMADGENYLNAQDLVVLNRIREQVKEHNEYLKILMPVIDQYSQTGAELSNYGIVLR